MTLNEALEQLALTHEDHAEALLELAQNLPSLPIQAVFENHRWFIQISDVRIGAL